MSKQYEVWKPVGESETLAKVAEANVVKGSLEVRMIVREAKAERLLRMAKRGLKARTGYSNKEGMMIEGALVDSKPGEPEFIDGLNRAFLDTGMFVTEQEAA